MNARQLYEQMDQSATRVNRVSETIAQNPLATLGAAALAGFLLGRVNRRLKQRRRIREAVLNG